VGWVSGRDLARRFAPPMSRDAFGPNLRRLRMQKKVSVEQIATSTKIAASLFHGLEKNDFSRWPTGVYARAYVRQYAAAVGADPDSTVDEFCRWFSQGDRRTAPIARDTAKIVGVEGQWQDVPPDTIGERRGPRARRPQPRPAPESPLVTWVVRLRRVLGRA
jgi:transcriptional regulator with XRE-family HTH domain